MDSAAAGYARSHSDRLALFDWNWLKGPLQGLASAALGRDLEIAAALDIDLSATPTLTLEQVRLGNVAWGSRPHMLIIPQVDVAVNRLKHALSEPARYHKIGHDGGAIERLFVDLFLEAHTTPPKAIILDLDATDDPLHGHQGAPPSSGAPTSVHPPVLWPRLNAS